LKLALKLKDKFTFDARALASEIVCPHCNNYTEELHQNRPILVRDLSVFGRECVFTSASAAVLLPGVVNVTLQKN
jgi:hypothetical protein